MNKTISLVVPVYCEELNVPLTYEVLTSLTKTLSQYSWELIFVNDGSKDQTLLKLRELAKHDQNCKIVDLSRNFGKEVALSAGVQHARGDAVICIDADLQHPPDRIPEMLQEWEKGAEVVEMVRLPSDKEPLFRRLGSQFFYIILRMLSDVEILAKTTDFRLLDRKVVLALNRIEERQRMFRGLVDWLGFRKVRLNFIPNQRQRGESVYSYAKLLNLALNSFISYSSIPLKLIGVLGILITVISFLMAFWMVLANAIDPLWFNFTPLAFAVVINTLLIGIVLTAMGLMSLYISKIYSEVQNRPLFTIRELINFN